MMNGVLQEIIQLNQQDRNNGKIWNLDQFLILTDQIFKSQFLRASYICTLRLRSWTTT
jgi:hypothetical protein